MKSSKNILRGLEISYSIAFIPVTLLYSFVILAFTSGHGSTIDSGSDVNPLQQENYIEFITNADQEINSNLKADIHDKKSMYADSVFALNKRVNPKAHSATPVFSNEVYKEKSLEIENWMLESKLFGKSINYVKDELDKPLEFEEWMINNCHFGCSSETFNDEELKVESWMTNNHFWGY